MSGPRRATLPSFTAMSRQSTAVLFGRTTRAFLITRSKVFSMPDVLALREATCVAQAGLASLHIVGFVDLRQRCCFILPTASQHLRRPDKVVERVEVKHACPERCGGAVGPEGAEEFLR